MHRIAFLLAIGLTPDQVIAYVTSNAARAIKRPDLGVLAEGSPADIAVFAHDGGGYRRLRVILTIYQGRVVWDPEGLAATDWSEAGPYSNYK